ncbi:dihydrolipoamide acetyltransferase family protein [Dongia deserti]|uniref:dihydrolipoamide acetyltransferase family protein n=1 Tax=Dongia deserti TaxID=2268030 RepID=UPI000E64D44C|nr:dihydrolipoamide acetyltransferase family protein [Dongia deserti]
MKTFRLPDLGEGLQDAEIVSWHVAAGDHVVADQPLVSVETDKAVIEVPSPQSGRIERLCAGKGERVKVGASLVEFAEGARADTGAIVGELTEPAAAPVEAKQPTLPPVPGLRAAPAVRRRARELSVELADVAGTGPGGAITIEDVEKLARIAAAATPEEELKGVRRAMAANMARSGAQIVPATVVDDADIGGWEKGEDLTVRLVRAIVAGCGASPALNAWYDGGRMTRRLHATIDLGLAVDTGDGLIVPVLRDVGHRDAASLRRGIDALKADVRARTVPLAELRGQTITLSNFGMFGGRYAALVIVPPQVAILGAGMARSVILPKKDGPQVRRVLPLSLTFDHRAVTGGEAARFLQAARQDLERET